MANMTYTTLDIEFENAMEASAAALLINSWRHVTDENPTQDRDWLGGIYANAGLYKPDAVDAIAYNVRGTLLGSRRNGKVVTLNMESAWTTSLTGWVDICEAQFPDATMRYWAEYEEGDRYTNDPEYADRWQIEAEGCSDTDATKIIENALGTLTAEAVSEKKLIETAKTIGLAADDAEEAVDSLLDIDVMAHEWVYDDIHDMD